MDKNKIFIIIASLIGAAAFITVGYFATNTKPLAPFQAEAFTIKKTDRIAWSKDKKHILTEYSDLQCPACATAHSFVKSEIQSDPEITKNVTFVYRHYPLTQIHPNANEAAAAAEAAGFQGKFFEMMDLMFENQEKWAESKAVSEVFTGYAKELKLDLEKYAADKASDQVQKNIGEDVASGNTLQISGTPTFYLDGRKLEFSNFTDFKKQLIDAAKQPKANPSDQS